MKRIIFLLYAILFVQSKVFSFTGDSTNPLSSSISYREKLPFAFKIGVDGVGFDYTFSPLNLNIEAGSMPLLFQGARIKYFFTNSNSTAFIGLGLGEKFASFGGSGESNRWRIIFVGWQFNFKRIFLDVEYQYVLQQENKKTGLPSIIGCGLGFRLF